ncbi:MAG TPA: hypothetical protein VM093_08075 [Aeromicrobium sp.]|nr:hypothetical protein [Aeromicrobium sp.]
MTSGQRTIPDGPNEGTSRYRDRIGELGEAAASLDALLRVLVSNCEQVCRDLDDGLSAVDSVRGIGDEAGRGFRRDVHAATTRFEQAMQASRGESLRLLVREGGIPVAQLSRLTGISAQMIRRLMRTAEDS